MGAAAGQYTAPNSCSGGSHRWSSGRTCTPRESRRYSSRSSFRTGRMQRGPRGGSRPTYLSRHARTRAHREDQTAGVGISYILASKRVPSLSRSTLTAVDALLDKLEREQILAPRQLRACSRRAGRGCQVAGVGPHVPRVRHVNRRVIYALDRSFGVRKNRSKHGHHGHVHCGTLTF